MLVRTSTVNESNVIELKKPISLNINENMNEYLLVIDVSWLMVEYILHLLFSCICYVTYIVVMFLYDVYWDSFSYMHVSHGFLSV